MAVPTVLINGVPFQLIEVNPLSGVLVLRLYKSDGSGFTGVRSPETGTDKEFVLPAAFAPLGQKGHILSDGYGTLEVLRPTTNVADGTAVTVDVTYNAAQLNGYFNAIITRLNLVMSALRTTWILQDNLSITPSPARFVLRADIATTPIKPNPARFVLSSSYVCIVPATAKVVFKTVAPTVTIT